MAWRVRLAVVAAVVSLGTLAALVWLGWKAAVAGYVAGTALLAVVLLLLRRP